MHLRQAIQYLSQTENAEYQSTGCDQYEIFDHDTNYQFGKICQWLKNEPGFPRVTRCLDIETVSKRMEGLCLSGRVPTPSQQVKSMEKLETMMKEIIATAVKIFEDIMTGKILTPNREGE